MLLNKRLQYTFKIRQVRRSLLCYMFREPRKYDARCMPLNRVHPECRGFCGSSKVYPRRYTSIKLRESFPCIVDFPLSIHVVPSFWLEVRSNDNYMRTHARKSTLRRCPYVSPRITQLFQLPPRDGAFVVVYEHDWLACVPIPPSRSLLAQG